MSKTLRRLVSTLDCGWEIYFNVEVHIDDEAKVIVETTITINAPCDCDAVTMSAADFKALSKSIATTQLCIEDQRVLPQ